MRQLAFRLQSHHLTRPLPAGQLEHASAGGIQHTLPGTAAVALGLRVKDFKPADLAHALDARRLVEITGLRGTSYLVAAKDFAVFTMATYPPPSPAGDKSLVRMLGPGWSKIKGQKGVAKLGARGVVDEVTAVLLDELDGRALTQDEIHERWRQRLPRSLLTHCRGCGSFHVPYTIVAAVGLRGSYCFGPEKDGITAYVRTEQWLKARDAAQVLSHDLESTRAELVRRFLRFYGPGTPAGFAIWAGISAADAREFWELVESEIVVAPDDEGAWLLRKDLLAYQSPPEPRAIQLLPPKDPFLSLPDRALLAPDKKLQAQVWRILGNPGVILRRGELVGILRMKKTGTLAAFEMELFSKLGKAERASCEEEAAAFAEYRECSRVKVMWK